MINFGASTLAMYSTLLNELYYNVLLIMNGLYYSSFNNDDYNTSLFTGH